MSIDKNYFVIAGYDLTRAKNDERFNDWRWEDESEQWFNGDIRLFHDPMDESHLFFGYVLVSGDEYDFPTRMFDCTNILDVRNDVDKALQELKNTGILNLENPLWISPYKIIVFEECY